MDRIRESGNVSLELLASIAEGVESLEQGLCRKAVKAIQKSLAATDARNRKLGTPTDFERQFRKQLKKGKKMKIRIITTKLVGGMKLDRPTNSSYGLEERVWCNGHQHVQGSFRIDGFKGWPRTVDTTVIDGTRIKKADSRNCTILEVSSCNCKNDSVVLLEAEVGNIPEGFAPAEALAALGACRVVGKGQVLVFVKEENWSEFKHTHDAFCLLEGESYTDDELSRGALLSDGENTELQVSVVDEHWNYHLGVIRVINQKGKPEIEDGQAILRFSK